MPLLSFTALGSQPAIVELRFRARTAHLREGVLGTPLGRRPGHTSGKASCLIRGQLPH